MAFGKVYCFGPTFRAEKSQDPPPPDRVLDGRARGRLPRPRRPHGARRAASSAHRRTAASSAARRSSRSSSATSTKLENVEGAVPPPPLRRRRRRCCNETGDRRRPGATTSARRTRRPCRQAVRPPGHGPPLPGRRSRRSTCSPTRPTRSSRCASTCSRPRATARSSAARQRIDDYDAARAADRGAQAAARGLRVVPRPAQVRLGPALRLRAGHGANRRVDRRNRAYPRMHSVPEDAAQDLPVTGVYVHVPFCRKRCPYCAFVLIESDGPSTIASSTRSAARSAPRSPSRGRSTSAAGRRRCWARSRSGG